MSARRNIKYRQAPVPQKNMSIQRLFLAPDWRIRQIREKTGFWGIPASPTLEIQSSSTESRPTLIVRAAVTDKIQHRIQRRKNLAVKTEQNSQTAHDQLSNRHEISR
jgi:hypothetical protein